MKPTSNAQRVHPSTQKRARQPPKTARQRQRIIATEERRNKRRKERRRERALMRPVTSSRWGEGEGERVRSQQHDTPSAKRKGQAANDKRQQHASVVRPQHLRASISSTKFGEVSRTRTHKPTRRHALLFFLPFALLSYRFRPCTLGDRALSLSATRAYQNTDRERNDSKKKTKWIALNAAPSPPPPPTKAQKDT